MEDFLISSGRPFYKEGRHDTTENAHVHAVADLRIGRVAPAECSAQISKDLMVEHKGRFVPADMRDQALGALYMTGRAINWA